MLALALLIATGPAFVPSSEWPPWRLEACNVELRHPPHVPVEPDASRACPPRVRVGMQSLQMIRLPPAADEAAEERVVREHIGRSCPADQAACPPTACAVTSIARELIDGQAAFEAHGTWTRGMDGGAADAAEPADDDAPAEADAADRRAVCGKRETLPYTWMFVRRPGGDGNDWILAEEASEQGPSLIVHSLRFHGLEPLTAEQRAAQRAVLDLAARARQQATRTLQLRERDRALSQAVEQARAAPPPAHQDDLLVYALRAESTGRFALFTWELKTGRARPLYQGHAEIWPFPMLTCARAACFAALGQAIQRISPDGAVDLAVPQLTGRPQGSELAASPAGDRLAYIDSGTQAVVIHEARDGRILSRHPWPERACDGRIEGWAGDGSGVVVSLSDHPGPDEPKDPRCARRLLLTEGKPPADAAAPLSPWGVQDWFRKVEPRAIATLPEGRTLLVSYRPNARGAREPLLVVLGRDGAEVASHRIDAPGSADWSALSFRVVGWLAR